MKREGIRLHINIRSVSFKMLLLTVLLVLPLNLLALNQSNVSNKLITKEIELSEHELVRIKTTKLKERYQTMQFFLSYYLLWNSDCIKMASQPIDKYQYDSAKYRFYFTFSKIVKMINGSDGYFYYMAEKDDTLFAYHSNQDNRTSIKYYVTDMCRNSTERGWKLVTLQDGIYYIRILRMDNICYGGWIRLDALADDIRQSSSWNSIDVFIGEAVSPIDDAKNLTIIDYLDDVKITVQISRQEILKNIGWYRTVVKTAAVFYFLLIPFLLILMRKYLIQPLNKLKNAHNRFQNGDLAYRIMPAGESSEYIAVYNSFNAMANATETLRIENYEKEWEKQRIEMHNLQLQIQPHFLQNTFNLVYTLSHRNETAELQEVILYLAEYFRVLSRTQMNPIKFKDELTLIKGYMRTAAIGYKGNVVFSADLQDGIEDINILPLIVHNFIENAVKYGVKSSGVTEITLKGTYTTEHVELEITDNGNGMSAEMLSKSQEIINGTNDNTNDTSHIGLRNSVIRMRFFYGERAHIDIRSVKGEGTCVNIRFPILLTGENNEFVDSE